MLIPAHFTLFIPAINGNNCSTIKNSNATFKLEQLLFVSLLINLVKIKK